MANYQIKFIGWCNTGKHDKLWGWVEVGASRQLYNFWGKRGKAYTFKEFLDHDWDDSEIRRLVRKKTDPDRDSVYKVIDPRAVEAVAPGFDAEFQHQFTLCKLFDKFHGKHDG